MTDDATMTKALKALGYMNPSKSQPIVGEPEWNAVGMAPRIPTDLASLLKRCDSIGLSVNLWISNGCYVSVDRRNPLFIGSEVLHCDPTDALITSLAAMHDAQEPTNGTK